MKKNLLLTTALVAVSFTASNAWAGDKTMETIDKETTISGKTYEDYTNRAITNKKDLTVEKSTFKKNKITSGHGGAIATDKSTTLNIKESTFSGNEATLGYGGSILTLADSKTTITDSDFGADESGQGNKAKLGGAIFNQGEMSIKGSSFHKNEATQDGGAIYSNKFLSITDSDFTENKATNGSNSQSHGGAIMSFGEADITNTNFKANESQFGGAIFNAGNMKLTGGTFRENKASATGGAIYSQGSTSLTLNDVAFKNNTSSSGGGAAYTAGITNVINGSFDDNKATYYGGALYAGDTATLNIEGTNFNRNQTEFVNGSGNGGAIYSKAATTIKNATFEGNMSGTSGAVYSDGGLTLENTTFKNNSAKKMTATDTKVYGGNGGALVLSVVESKETKNVIKNATFIGNSADIYGGAMYTAANLDISDSRFSDNSADFGGSMVIGDKTVKMTNNVFENNTATSQGGAILITLGANSQPKADVTAEGSIFRGNSSQMGGAITNFSKLSLKNSSFTNNKAITEGSDSDLGSGGALFLGSSSTTNLEEVTFSGNTSFKNGGAIGTRETTDNSKSNLTVKSAAFTDNHADGEGGALYLGEKTKASFDGGEIVFANNTDKNGLNDIAMKSNESELTVKNGASLTLDGGISGKGKLKLEKGSSLNVKDTTNIEAQTSVESGTGLVANLNVVVTGKTTKSGKLALYGTKEEGAIFQGQNGETPLKDLRFDTAKNNLFDFDTNDQGKTYEVSAKSTREIAGKLGVNNTEASTLLAVSSTESTGNAKLDGVLSTLQETSQYGDGSEDLSKEADALGADAAPVVQTRETALANMIFDAASDALDDNLTNAAVGQSSGDSVFEKAKVWVKGLFNYADKDDTSKARGFDIDTYGVAMGIDKEVGAGKVGLGYAYSESDIGGYTRDTDVDTHSVFLYGQYKPADWYVKGVAAYSWSDYEEKKSVLGENANAKYDVNTLALQGLYGYNLHIADGYDITPEAGLRYLRASQDSTTNGLGVRVKDRDIDVLTAVAGVKVAKNFTVTDSLTIRPEVRAALTYDLKADDNDSVVTMGNTSYRLNGEKLDRFGAELGAKLATDITSQWEVAAGYEGRFREDYSDHTGILSAKYKF